MLSASFCAHQHRIPISNIGNLDWSSAQTDRLSTSQPQTKTRVVKTAEQSEYFHGVPLTNSPGPVPYGEQALTFLCSAFPACVVLVVLFGLCHPAAATTDSFTRSYWNSSNCKPGNSAGQSCSHSLGN